MPEPKQNIYSGLKSRIAKELGIDLGTVNTLVYMKGKGIIIREPSVVAVDLVTNTIVAVGREAQKMIGRTPSRISAIRPMRQGVIADFETTKKMLSYFIGKACGKSPLTKPRVVLSVPYGTTQVEKRAVIEAALQAGAKEAFLIEEPLAAAMGAGLPVEEAIGNMVVNIGGGTTEIAVISLGGVVNGSSIRTAGDALDQAVINYMRKQYRMEIGERTAEDVKIKAGYACEPDPDLAHRMKGISRETGMPASVEICATEVTEALQEPLERILSGIREVYEKTSPELAGDIIDRGITLTGGGALLRRLDRLISQRVNLPVHLAEDPQDCVAKGTGKTIQQMHTLARLALFQ